MQDKIYLVMYSFYSDWTIYGFFTNRTDAEKYCVANPEKELYVKEVKNYDNIEGDFRNIDLKYTFNIMFKTIDLKGNSGFIMEHFDWQYGIVPYQSEFLKSNKLESAIPSWVRVLVNLEEKNIDRAQKIAQDLLYQYLAMFNNKVTEENIKEFNKILSQDEYEREEKKKQDKIRELELAELKRLREKYNV